MGRAYDVIVVGVGGVGAATCLQLARRGQRVLGLERFDVPHAEGSSHGGNRMIRLAYFEGAAYVPLVLRAHALWHDLGREAGEQLIWETGTLDLAPAGAGVVEEAEAACRAHGLAHETFDAAGVMQRWPVFRLPAGHVGLLQPQGGFVASERGIVAQVGLALDAGAEIRAREMVLDWQPLGDGVRVRTERGTYEAGALVLSAGAWISRFVPPLAAVTQPYRQVFGWFRPRTPEAFAQGRFPSFTMLAEGGHFYGFPLWQHPGFKVGGPHHGREACDPDTVDRAIRDSDIAGLADWLERFIPDAAGSLLALRTCLYTMTPDEHFIVDRLPGLPQVIVASPCSGHGYKFTPVMGEVLADLACGRTPAFDISGFALSRFI